MMYASTDINITLGIGINLKDMKKTRVKFSNSSADIQSCGCTSKLLSSISLDTGLLVILSSNQI